MPAVFTAHTLQIGLWAGSKIKSLVLWYRSFDGGIAYQTMHYFKLGGILAIFWLLLSGHTGALLLTLGLLSVLLVVWLISRMDRHDQMPMAMVFNLQFVRYVGWLVWQVVLSNLAVARRIWDPALPIQPVWKKIDVSVKTPLFKTIYANSITLTPGTVTTDVGEDYFVVHALNGADIDGLQGGEMERRIKQMEDVR